MTETGLRTVFYISAHTFDLSGMVGTLSKTVRHKHIKHVGISEAHALLALLLTGLKLILDLCLTKGQGHRTGLGILEVEVDEQVVGRVEAYEAVDPDTWIVGGYTGNIANALAINHQLDGGVFHPYIPVGGIYAVNHCLFGCHQCECCAYE